MTQYIDKNEVENILRNLWKQDDGSTAEHRICYNKALQEVQCELDTLEVKEKILDKSVHEAFKSGYDMDVIQTTNKMKCNTKEVDLEKEFDKCCENYVFDDECEVYTARHFFELGLKVQKGE